jgi:hypothetical protein
MAYKTRACTPYAGGQAVAPRNTSIPSLTPIQPPQFPTRSDALPACCTGARHRLIPANVVVKYKKHEKNIAACSHPQPPNPAQEERSYPCIQVDSTNNLNPFPALLLRPPITPCPVYAYMCAQAQEEYIPQQPRQLPACARRGDTRHGGEGAPQWCC